MPALEYMSFITPPRVVPLQMIARFSPRTRKSAKPIWQRTTRPSVDLLKKMVGPLHSDVLQNLVPKLQDGCVS